MKTRLQKLQLLMVLACATLNVKAQSISGFENLPLTPGTYWTGTDASGDSVFVSGSAKFHNSFNGYWSAGWAYSNVVDTTTVGYTNTYGSFTGGGQGSSSNYAVGKDGAKIIIDQAGKGGVVNGVYITNGTYAALSMKNGDQFAKKFGGTDGNDKDWFLLTIKGYAQGTLKLDSVDFYLADFRFDDNEKDYMVTAWEYVDLTTLGEVDSLLFSLTSSDNGAWGMNTPAYFCLDQLEVAAPTGVENLASGPALKLFPNPVESVLNVGTSELIGGNLFIHDMSGQLLEARKVTAPQTSIQVSELPAGVYALKITSDGKNVQKRFIKN